MKQNLFFLMGLIALSEAAIGARVIDLGSQQIQGQFRGPELQLIDSDTVSDETASRILYTSLKQLEARLLQPEPLRSVSNDKQEKRK